MRRQVVSVRQFESVAVRNAVLLRVASGELDLTVDGARPPAFGYPLSWCFGEGDGRVFSTTLGHFPAAYESPTIR